jgi:signal transduction histidine kinase
VDDPRGGRRLGVGPARRGARSGLTALAVVGFGLTLIGVVVAAVGSVLAGYGVAAASATYVLPQGLIGLSCAVSGGLIAWQRPRNPVGWLLLSAGVLQTATAAAAPWIDVGVRLGWSSGSMGVLVALYAYTWPWGVGLCVPMALLLFPDGALPSRRWSPVAVLVVLGGVLFVVALGGESVLTAAARGAPMGLEFPGFGDLPGLGLGIKIANLLLDLVVLASLIRRYRHGTDRLRRQMLWLLLATAVFAVSVPTSQVLGGGPVLLFLTLALIPLAIMVAVLRHRLFDIDVVVRRSLVYGVLSLAIAAVYVAISAVPGIALGARIPVELAVVLTLVAAVGFHPLRRRLDHLADRLVFGPRINRYELLTTFGASLEQAVELGELLPRLADTVHRGLAASWVTVSLPDTKVHAGRPDGPPALSVALERGPHVVGRIECGDKDGGYEPGDLELLSTLAGQAATAIANVELTAQLAGRLEDLTRSRGRIVAAQDSERRRIERDLHDGAQQHVVALITKLRLARNQLGRGERDVEEVLGELQTDARELLTDLRDFAHGIHPPVLTDRGLVAAVEARADRLPLTVTVAPEPSLRDRRLRPEVEAAAYFTVCEALTNIVKHAHAGRAHVALSTTERHLTITVEDDGVGFTPTDDAGHGLTNVRDRIETLGGTVQVEGESDSGTTLRAHLPVGTPHG